MAQTLDDYLLGQYVQDGKPTQLGAGSGGGLGDLFGGLFGGGSKGGDLIGGLAGAGAGLLAGLFGHKTDPYQDKMSSEADQLSGEAGQLFNEGNQFVNYELSGTLPAPLQAQVDKATAGAKARVVSTHATAGQSTDPRYNSALAQEFSDTDRNALALKGTLEQQLAQTGMGLISAGLQASSLEAKLYESLYKIDADQSKQMGQMISQFAAAASKFLFL